ncbi:hypothetical protein F2Q70_00017927 [Brassica cretica]|uniref:Uncharacterized protein n=1 Tax=Brassica cretica TaxID=69181 RepID=A0A8S9HYB5_BRACR|nr:hypothetical protein F2Q70_00017927 [Brassica cretica]
MLLQVSPSKCQRMSSPRLLLRLEKGLCIAYKTKILVEATKMDGIGIRSRVQTIVAPHLANGRLESGESRKSTLIQGSITVHLLNYFENHCSIGYVLDKQDRVCYATNCGADMVKGVTSAVLCSHGDPPDPWQPRGDGASVRVIGSISFHLPLFLLLFKSLLQFLVKPKPTTSTKEDKVMAIKSVRLTVKSTFVCVKFPVSDSSIDRGLPVKYPEKLH